MNDFLILWSADRPQGIRLVPMLVFLGAELLLLTGYVYYVWQMWLHIVETQGGEDSAGRDARLV